MKFHRIKLLDVQIDTLTKANILDNISKHLEQNIKHYIVTPNPEFIIESLKNSNFKKILNNASVAIPDGIGILWAAKFLSLKTKSNQIFRFFQIIWQYIYSMLSILLYPKYIRSVIPERVTGSDLIWDICKIANQKNKSIYLLGAKKGIAKKSALIIKQKFPNIKIAGAQSGGFPIDNQEKGIICNINNSDADILFVALGAPKQEIWIDKNLIKLESVKLAVGIGGALDFISGNIKRAPKLLNSLGLEWLYRLFKEPSRLRRIYNATIIFPLLVLKYKLLNNNE